MTSGRDPNHDTQYSPRAQVSPSLSTTQRLHSPSSLMMGILVITQQPGKPTWTLLARCLESNTGEGVSIPNPLRAVLGALLYFCIPANPTLSLSFQVKFISRSPDHSPCFSRWLLAPPLEMHAVCQGWTGTFRDISTKKNHDPPAICDTQNRNS